VAELDGELIALRAAPATDAFLSRGRKMELISDGERRISVEELKLLALPAHRPSSASSPFS
jgi:hypothetical protein